MRLNARDRPASSSPVGASATRTREVAAAHAFGGVDQPPDRPRDLIGQHQADQHRGQQHQQRHDARRSRRRRSAARSGSGRAAGIRRPPARCASCDRGSAGSTGRPIISISGGVESSRTTACTRVPSPAASTTTSPPCACDGHALRRQLDAHAGEQPGRGQHLPGQRIVDHRLGQAAQRRLRRQHLGEHRRIGGQELAGARQVVGHLQRDGRGCCRGARPDSRARPAATR